MGLKRQEFYEGAALHLLVRGGYVRRVRYAPPFFLFNEKVAVLLKYCAKSRSPWNFTFTPNEQEQLEAEATECQTEIGLICGSDGVAVVSYEAFASLIFPTSAAVRIACYRVHGGHYDVSGPAGGLTRKISPSRWQKILDN